jgi:2-dehydropantoate 2-reductase
LAPRVRIVCLQNGVTNHGIFATESKHVAIPSVVYVAAEMKSPTHLLHNAGGNLLLSASEELRPLVRLFESANIPCRTTDFIERELWEKLIINSALNGISAAGRARYGEIMHDARMSEVMKQIIGEAVAVANAIQIPLEFDAVRRATWKVGETMHAAYSSTAQDIQRGKRTEIDYLNGHIVALGQQHGIATPVNQAIHALVKLLETTSR